MAPRLLLIEDDHKLARLLTAFASAQGYELSWADRPSAGLARLAESPDLILLDVMLPEQSGFDLCRQLRAAGNQTPIIMLTARGDDLDRIRGLKLGADDYLPKPFNPEELFARVEAVLRRPPMTKRLSDGLDKDRLVLRVQGREIELTPSEFRLVEAMSAVPGQLFSRERLLDLLGDEDTDRFDRSIDAHISRLRLKLELDPRQPRHLITVRGFGYRFAW